MFRVWSVFSAGLTVNSGSAGSQLHTHRTSCFHWRWSRDQTSETRAGPCDLQRHGSVSKVSGLWILQKHRLLTTSCWQGWEELWCRWLTGDIGSHDNSRLRWEMSEDAGKRLHTLEGRKLDDGQCYLENTERVTVLVLGWPRWFHFRTHRWSEDNQ